MKNLSELSAGDAGFVRQWAPSLAATLLIAALTLGPADPGEQFLHLNCVVCGDRGLADVILNVLLFLPLGLTLGRYAWATYRGILIAALLSALIELAQLIVPGRDASIGDVIFNTAGAALGIFAFKSSSLWLRPRHTLATALSLASAIAVVATFSGTGYLFQPSFPFSSYYGQWTPNLGFMEWYRGQVLRAVVGDVEIPPKQLAEPERVTVLLRAGAPLRIHALAGPSVPALGSLVSIFDDERREILLLGPDRSDLVYRYRLRANDFRFDRPDLRLRGAMESVRPGDSLRVRAWRDPKGVCLSLNSAVQCRLGFGVGLGWALLMYPEFGHQSAVLLLSACWVALLFAPISFWARSAWVLSLGLALALSGMFLVTLTMRLPLPTAFEIVGAGAGTSLGWFLGRSLGGRAARG